MLKSVTLAFQMIGYFPKELKVVSTALMMAGVEVVVLLLIVIEVMIV